MPPHRPCRLYRGDEGGDGAFDTVADAGHGRPISVASVTFLRRPWPHYGPRAGFRLS